MRHPLRGLPDITLKQGDFALGDFRNLVFCFAAEAKKNMATLQSGSSPGQRVKAGDTLIARARSVEMKPVKARFATMKATHAAYGAANTRVVEAALALVRQERIAGENDAVQDGSVDVLAIAEIAAGANRLKPLDAYKLGTVSTLREMPVADEAKTLIKLANKASKSKNAGVAEAAATMLAAAEATLASLKPIPALIKQRNEAIQERDALAPSWERAFAALKRAVRNAENDGATGLFAALFEVEKPKAKEKKPKVAKDEPKA